MKHIKKIFEQKDPFQYKDIDPILKSSDFLKKKQDLIDYFESVGFEVEMTQPFDISGDGTAESLIVRFIKGDVIVIVAMSNYSYPDPKNKRKGKFAYQLNIAVSKDAGGEILLSCESDEAVVEDINQIKKVASKYLEQGRLKGLGVKDAAAVELSEIEKEDRIPSKKEYDEMLNNAIDSNDRKRAEEIVNKWGDKFYKENTSYKKIRIKKFEQFSIQEIDWKKLRNTGIYESSKSNQMKSDLEIDTYNFNLCYKFFSKLLTSKNKSLEQSLDRLVEGKDFIKYIVRFLIKNDIMNDTNHEDEYIFMEYEDKEKVKDFFKMAQHNLYQRICLDVSSPEIDENDISCIYDDILTKSKNKTYLSICNKK